jgi:hypothetical protein
MSGGLFDRREIRHLDEAHFWPITDVFKIMLELLLTPVDGVAWNLADFHFPVSWERWPTCYEVECHWICGPHSCVYVH